MKKDVDECHRQKGVPIPCCKLAIDWNGPETSQLPVLKRRVNLTGAKAPNNFFTLHICPPPSPLPVAAAVSATSAAGQ